MNENPHIFSQEELDNIAGLGEVLRNIHKRLLSEGKIKVENGKTIFLENKNGISASNPKRV